MPELPEVETIRRQLLERVIGLTIKDVKMAKSRLFIGNSKDIIGAEITDVRRRAKQVIIDLKSAGHPDSSNRHPEHSEVPPRRDPAMAVRSDGLDSSVSPQNDNLHLLIHLKMTGQLIYVDRNGQFGGGHPTSPRLRGAGPVPPPQLDYPVQVPNKYTYVIFEFSDGSALYYNDLRQFGWIKIVGDKELEKELDKFGPEPLDKNFNVKRLKINLLKHKRLKIKPTLMDQSVVAGLGNIYAAEVCFRAGILPERKIETLSDKDFKNIFEAIKEVLPLAIKYKGTSADAYVTLEGKKGEYFSKLWIYGRDGEPCPKDCGGKIAKVMMSGRGTYYCPKCQQ